MKPIYTKIGYTLTAITGVLGGVTTVDHLAKIPLPTVFFILVILLAVGAAVVLFKVGKKEYGYIASVVAAIFIGVPIYETCKLASQNKKIALWNDAIIATQIQDPLKERADNNDAIAQYELAERYMKQMKYKEARDYAQKAANNYITGGHLLLATLDLRGAGVTPNPQQAIKNQLEANKISRVDNTIFLTRFRDAGFEMSALDSLEWNERMKQVDRMELCTIRVMGATAYGDESDFLECYHSAYDELVELSEFGYIPATRVLYMAEKREHPEGSPRLKHIALLLKLRNSSPTGSKEAIEFRKLLGEEVDLTEDRYRQFMDESFYPLQSWVEENAVRIDTMKNESLFKLYPYLRAQDDFYLRGRDDHQYRTIFSEEAYNSYDRYAEISDSLLQVCTRTIRERMPKLER